MINSALKELKYIFNQKNLISQFTKREITSRYKGSYLGLLWSIVTPLMMLIIYTFVFSAVLKTKWGTGEETSKVEFALLLLAGLLTFNFFAEVISRAPSLITANTNYVKKVVFPLEILPIVSLGTALFQAFISYVVLIIASVVLMGDFQWTVFLFPIILIPLMLLTLGLSWFLASFGVYVRDTSQVIALIIPALMFMSPIFYPISIIPDEFQIIYWFNPLTYIVEDARRVLVWGQLPHWDWFLYGSIIGLAVALIGYIWFKKTRKGFADVL